MALILIDEVLYYQGCDVSRWQGGINYNVFTLDFVIYKASGGDMSVCYVDPMFRQNAAGFHTAEGPYHFAGRHDPAVEANFFANTILDSAWADMERSKQIAPTLDAEWFTSVWDDRASGGRNKAEWCKRFFGTLEPRVNREGILYSGPASVGIYPDPDLTRRALWLAAYVGYKDSFKYTGGFGPWEMWQYSSTGSVTGVKGNCDMNMANAAWLQNHLSLPATTVPVTPFPIPVHVPDIVQKKEIDNVIIVATTKPDSAWANNYGVGPGTYAVDGLNVRWCSPLDIEEYKRRANKWPGSVVFEEDLQNDSFFDSATMLPRHPSDLVGDLDGAPGKP